MVGDYSREVGVTSTCLIEAPSPPSTWPALLGRLRRSVRIRNDNAHSTADPSDDVFARSRRTLADSLKPSLMIPRSWTRSSRNPPSLPDGQVRPEVQSYGSVPCARVRVGARSGVIKAKDIAIRVSADRRFGLPRPAEPTIKASTVRTILTQAGISQVDSMRVYRQP